MLALVMVDKSLCECGACIQCRRSTWLAAAERKPLSIQVTCQKCKATFDHGINRSMIGNELSIDTCGTCLASLVGLVKQWLDGYAYLPLVCDEDAAFEDPDPFE